jgi:hypothetical protein
MSRMLIDVTNLLDAGNSREVDALIRREVCDLADEINSALPDYECTFVHLDTHDFLCFVPTADANYPELHADECAV